MAIIGKIREQVGLLVFIVALAIIAFLLTDALSSRSPSAAGNVAGTIDGKDISYNEVSRLQQDIENRYQANGLNIDERTRLNIREQAWTQYIEQLVAQREYDRLGLNITSDELTDIVYTHPSIVNEPIFQNEQGQFDPNLLVEYRNQLNGNTPDARTRKAQFNQFLGSVRDNSLREKYTNLVKKAIYIPDWYAEQNAKLNNQKANFDYVFIPYSTIQDTEVQITDADLNTYLKNHISDFDTEGSRSIQYVTFTVNPTAADTLVAKDFIANNIAKFRTTNEPARFVNRLRSDDDYEDTYLTRSQVNGRYADDLFTANVNTVFGPYYESGKYKAVKLVDRRLIPDSVQVRQISRMYSAQQGPDVANKVIDSLTTVINNGSGSIENLASEFSQDAYAQNGGDRGYVKLSTQGLEPEVLQAVFFDNQEGSLVKIPTQRGVVLAEIVDADPTTPAVKTATLSKVIRAGERTRKTRSNEVRQFVAQNRNLESFNKAAQAESISVNTASGIKKNDYEIEGIGVAPDIVTWLFKNNEGDISDRFSIDQTLPDGRTLEKYYVVGITNVVPEGKPTVANLRDDITPLVRNQKKAEKIKSKIGNAASLQDVASATNQSVQSAQNATFGGATLPNIGKEPKVQATVFATQPNTMSKVIEGDRGVYVVQPTNFTDAAATDINQTRSTIAQPLQRQADANLIPALAKAVDVEDNRYKLRQ